MSYALQALIAIRLEAYRGDWLVVDAIAAQLRLAAKTVGDCLEQMAGSGEWPTLELRRDVYSEAGPDDCPDSIVALTAARFVASPQS